MASVLGMNRRRADAQARIDAALPAVVDRHGIDVPPVPSHRDANFESALRAEWTADVLEALAAVPKPEPAKAPAKTTRKPASKASGERR